MLCFELFFSIPFLVFLSPVTRKSFLRLVFLFFFFFFLPPPPLRSAKTAFQLFFIDFFRYFPSCWAHECSPFPLPYRRSKKRASRCVKKHKNIHLSIDTWEMLHLSSNFSVFPFFSDSLCFPLFTVTSNRLHHRNQRLPSRLVLSKSFPDLLHLFDWCWSSGEWNFFCHSRFFHVKTFDQTKAATKIDLIFRFEPRNFVRGR